jgi:hypothetical protein
MVLTRNKGGVDPHISPSLSSLIFSLIESGWVERKSWWSFGEEGRWSFRERLVSFGGWKV